jgi:hypothetical protein
MDLSERYFSRINVLETKEGRFSVSWNGTSGLQSNFHSGFTFSHRNRPQRFRVLRTPESISSKKTDSSGTVS